jgi:hypothetical protein
MIALTLEEQWIIFQLCYDHDLYRVLHLGLTLWTSGTYN